MATITAKNFVNIFEQVTHEQQQSLLQHWPDPPSLTNYVASELMPRIASIFNCNLKREHQRIDFVLTTLSVCQANSSQDFEIVAAIEHENNFTGSNSEMVELKIANAPLGVLITYVSVPQRQRMLKEYAQTLSSITQQSGPDAGKILVIFGLYGMKRPQKAIWEYFTYHENQFIHLSVS